MKVNKSDLLKTLEYCKPGLAKREIIAEAVRFLFTGEKVCTYNDEISILAPFTTDFQCSVNGEELYKILSGIKDDDIDLSLDKDQLKIKSKKTRAGLSTIVGEKERIIDRIQQIEDATKAKSFWKKLPKDFVEGVSLCMFNASKDMTTGVRSCVAIKKDRVYSTDQVRISRFIMSDSVAEMLIPARNAAELVKYPIVRYGISEGWLHFLTDDGIMFNCRMMVGVYPYEIDSFFRAPVNEITLPEELGEVMKEAVIMATGDEVVAKMVEMKLTKGKIICRSEKERGWMEKEIDFDYKGKDMIFYINPVFFAQILQKVTSLFLIRREEFPDEEFPDKACFTREKYQHIIALPA